MPAGKLRELARYTQLPGIRRELVDLAKRVAITSTAAAGRNLSSAPGKRNSLVFAEPSSEPLGVEGFQATRVINCAFRV